MRGIRSTDYRAEFAHVAQVISYRGNPFPIRSSWTDSGKEALRLPSRKCLSDQIDRMGVGFSDNGKTEGLAVQNRVFLQLQWP